MYVCITYILANLSGYFLLKKMNELDNLISSNGLKNKSLARCNWMYSFIYKTNLMKTDNCTKPAQS